MIEKNNISQFDNLFKEGLSGHTVPTPTGAFQGISQGLSSGSVGSAAIGVKLLVGSILAVTIATAAYFAINTDAKKKDAPIAVEQQNNTISDNDTNKESLVVTEDLMNTTAEKNLQLTQIPVEKSTKSIPIKKDILYITDNLNDAPLTEDRKLMETIPKNTVVQSDIVKNVVAANTSVISISGNSCPYSKAEFAIYPANSTVVWFVNDNKIAANTSSCSYVFNQKGFYKIECYSNKTKIADTFIEIGIAKATINYIDMGAGLTEAKADIIGVKSMSWMVNGYSLSDLNGFIYNTNHLKIQPYLVTIDFKGCKDTFYKKGLKNSSEAYFILGKENAITPNGDGLNDEYEFEIEGQTFFNMVVFDKNEQIIYSTTNPKAFWNGVDSRTQKVAENGAYNIVFTYQLEGENENNFKYVRINLLK